MANKHISYVFDSEDVKGADRLMLLAIADYCDEHGSCYPSYQTLAKKCNVDRRNAIATCQRLESGGHIYISKKDGYVTSNGSTNRFFMLKWRKSVGLNNDEFTSDENDTSDAHITPLVMPTSLTTSDAHITQTQEETQEETQDSLPPEGGGADFLVSKSGIVHSNNNGKPLCGSNGKHYTETSEGEVTCKSCRKKLGLDDTRDPIKDWAAYHVFGSDPRSVPESLGYLVGNWRNGIHEVHKAKANGNGMVEPTTGHLDMWKEWYDERTKGEVNYPRDRAKIVASYAEFYDEKRRIYSQKSTHTHHSDVADSQYKNVIDETTPPQIKALSHG